MIDLKIHSFDDGYFPVHYKGRRGKTILVGLETRGLDIDKLSWKPVVIDSRECSLAIIELSKLLGESDLILLDGVTYAGFDVVDPDEIHTSTNAPVVVVQQYPLNLERVRRALFRNFTDAYERYVVVEKTVNRFQYLDTPWKTIQYCAVGIEVDKAKEYLLKTMIYSPVPEPLRIAHILASTLSRKVL